MHLSRRQKLLSPEDMLENTSSRDLALFFNKQQFWLGKGHIRKQLHRRIPILTALLLSLDGNYILSTAQEKILTVTLDVTLSKASCLIRYKILLAQLSKYPDSDYHAPLTILSSNLSYDHLSTRFLQDFSSRQACFNPCLLAINSHYYSPMIILR